MGFIVTLILVVICIAFEAFFSGAEIALISANRIKIQHRAKKKDAACQAVNELWETPDRTFAMTSLGTNLAMVTCTAIFTAYMVAHFGEAGDLLAMVILTPLILMAGEIIPKMVFQNAADQMILSIIKPLKFFQKLLSPAVSFITVFSDQFLKRVLRQTEANNSFSLNREQIRQIIHPQTPTELDSAERKMIHKIFNFGEIAVEQCMAPLVQIHSIRDTATLKESHEIASESGFSRLPVFHDRMFNLIGVLNTFDLLNEPSDDSPITSLIRPAYYIPPNKKIDDLLQELQQRGLHMAIVVDEYGGCVGIITIEDLLEEIVGEIEDEFDEQEKLCESYADGSFLIEADKQIDAINEQLNLNLPNGDYETLGGLMIAKLEKIPSPGDQVITEGYRLTVKEAGKRKVNSVIVRKLPVATSPEKPDNA